MKTQLIATAVLALGIVPAHAALVTSVGGIGGLTRVVNFEAFDGLLTAGPVGVAPGVSFTGDAAAELGANNRDLGENGTWGGFGNHFVAGGDPGELTFSFANLVSGAGAFLNHFAATPGSGSITLSAFDVGGGLLESYTFTIATAIDDYDAGQFFGISRGQFEIAKVTFSGVGVVADDLVFASVPEPTTHLLVLSALGALGFTARRRAAKR